MATMEASATLSYPEIEGAIKTAAMEKCSKRGFNTGNPNEEDVQKFLRALTVVQIDEREIELPLNEVICNNTSSEDWKMPHSTTDVYETKTQHSTAAGLKGDVKVDTGCITVANAKVQGEISANTTNTEHHKVTHNIERATVPRKGSVTVQETVKQKVFDLRVRASVSTQIRVHPGNPVTGGAMIGGGTGGAGGGVAGAGAGGTAGGLIGGAIGVVGGPPGILAGATIGAVIGGLAGVVVGGGGGGAAGAGIGAAIGRLKRSKRQFTINARDVFQQLEDFEDKGKVVYCRIKITYCYNSEQWNIQ